MVNMRCQSTCWIENEINQPNNEEAWNEQDSFTDLLNIQMLFHF